MGRAEDLGKTNLTDIFHFRWRLNFVASCGPIKPRGEEGFTVLLHSHHQRHEVHHRVYVLPVPAHVLEGAEDAQAAERLELADVGPEVEDNDVEVVNGATQHLLAHEVEGREHFIDVQELFVPMEDLRHIVQYHRQQEDVDHGVHHADDLEDGQRYQFASDEHGGGGGRVRRQEAGLDVAVELVLVENAEVEEAQVEAGEEDEKKQEEVPEQVGERNEVGTLFARQVTLQQRIFKVSNMAGAEK